MSIIIIIIYYCSIALQTFKSWKEKKDVVLKGKVKQHKMTEREKKELEAEGKARKEKESWTAFRGWYVQTCLPPDFSGRFSRFPRSFSGLPL